MTGWLIWWNCRSRTERRSTQRMNPRVRKLPGRAISQREALQMLKCIISNIEYLFYKAYDMEIEDKRTVYGDCSYRLVPREDEPNVCLMHDWIYLPSA